MKYTNLTLFSGQGKALITLCEDIYVVQGQNNDPQIVKIMPDIQNALKELPPWWFNQGADLIDTLSLYAKLSSKQRHKLLKQALTQKVTQDAMWASQWFLGFLAAICSLLGGITWAELEQQLEQQLKGTFSTITLPELLGKETANDIPHSNLIRHIYSKVGFTTGSIAGKNKRLKVILDQRFRDSIGDIPLYEQDLKVAMSKWHKGNHRGLIEIVE